MTFSWRVISLRSHLASILWRQVQRVIDGAAIEAIADDHGVDSAMDTADINLAVSCLRQWVSQLTADHLTTAGNHAVALKTVPLTLQMQETTVYYGSAIALKAGAGHRPLARAIAQLLTLTTHLDNIPISQSGDVSQGTALGGFWFSDRSMTYSVKGWLNIGVGDRALAAWLEQLCQCPLRYGETLPSLRTDFSRRDRCLVWEMQRAFARCETLKRLAQKVSIDSSPLSASRADSLDSISDSSTQPICNLTEGGLKLSPWLTSSGRLALSESTEWALLETIIQLVDQLANLGWGDLTSIHAIDQASDRPLVRSLAQDLCERVWAVDAACRILSPAIAPYRRQRWQQWIAIAQVMLSWLLVAGWQVRPVPEL